MMKHIGTVGYIGNSPYTYATGTMSAECICEKVDKKFYGRVMFITSSKVICRVVEEGKDKKDVEDYKKDLAERNPENVTF